MGASALSLACERMKIVILSRVDQSDQLINIALYHRVNRDVLPLVREEEAAVEQTSTMCGDEESCAAARRSILELEDTIVTEMAQAITAVRDLISIKIVWCEMRAELLERLYTTDPDAIAKFKVQSGIHFCFKVDSAIYFGVPCRGQAEQKRSGKAAVDSEPSCIGSRSQFSSAAARESSSSLGSFDTPKTILGNQFDWCNCCAELDGILAELNGLLVSTERESMFKGVLTALLGLLGWTLTNPDHTRILAQVDSTVLEADLGTPNHRV